MKVIRALEKVLEEALGMQAVVEPSNAIARKEVRVMFNGIRGLNRLPLAVQGSYVPYEMLVDVVISARVSGGNTQCFLSSQQMQLNLCMTDFLANDLIVLKDIGEALPPGFGGLSERLTIKGDAEISDARKIGSSWSEPKRDDDFEHKDELFVWREDWQATLELTVHKQFTNPEVTEITAHSELTGESHTISDEEQ
ncbi:MULTISPECIES: hypothetical protein [unclassified Vibrio]|uniref:hypothetical protein n=1 Tax=unclassified Vibrio TaxID=2614977 RepID=UPI000B8E414D|nr:MULTISPECIES: hypothetical protein [unclassified Vibrio]NAW98986.1 hypothetical protein [Vibrio sp. V23_P3S9T160]OXX25753.1 hypothetical protein B9J88_03460 [Vibrio sp. V05_P4A8T149]OXX29954.1 hypothetical protein B9J81_17115 [Vibrio sp. V04_P4A5T148]OXX32417.1 hypothetical protein B9J95_07130 [Vibrio sp. V14_P6S14T42]OXX41169.1 hypothetical protein B9J85_14585 [Vibrio sp. V11_P1A41T118]